MSYITDRYKVKKLSSQSLAVTECGIQICNSGHATPPIPYQEYAIHFILEGQGTFSVNGKNYHIKPGQGFLITPHAECHYVADVHKPWKYVYACFSGIDDDALVHSAGLNEEDVVFDFPLSDDMIRDIYAMHSAGKHNTAKGYEVTGYFLLIMSRLIKATKNKKFEYTQPEKYVKKAKTYIEDNYSFSINVSDIAYNVGLDRTYLYRLFIKIEGISPSDYLTEYRINKSAEKLLDKSIPINEVSLSSGFKDISYFYKVFLKKYNITPKKYRELHTTNDDL